MKFAGGHDPGPLQLPKPAQEGEVVESTPAAADAQEKPAEEKPFLPARPPVELGSSGEGEPGPWGPHRR
jgi:heat shock protein HtpX